MQLSVIVCTRNRAHAIVPCLDSIATSLAHAAPVDAEILVVDNGSTDSTSQVVREWAVSRSFPINLQFEPRKGLAVARNCGIRAAQGELLAWTDDDCRLSENFISDLLRYDAGDTELVLRSGRVELGDSGDLPLTIKTDSDSKRRNKKTNPLGRESISGMIAGCNIAMRRALINKVGFFDERFGAGTSIPGSEDIDYVYRAYLAGMTIESVPDMVVFHHHGRKSATDGYQLMRNYSISGGAMAVKYFFKAPHHARQLYWDFKNAVREIKSGTNTFLPEIGFSHRNKVVYSILGAARFFLLTLKRTKPVPTGKRFKA